MIHEIFSLIAMLAVIVFTMAVFMMLMSMMMVMSVVIVMMVFIVMFVMVIVCHNYIVFVVSRCKGRKTLLQPGCNSP